VPAPIAKLFEEKKQAIIAGKLLPFAGPVVDQAGVVKVAAGADMPLKDLMSFNFYVKGVEGSIPK
jgi:simple sugar transport system substrate-binding protein